MAALGKRTVNWIQAQFERRSLGRAEIPPIKRKVIKCFKDSIYFVGDPDKTH
jgi:hypothetical protein